VLQRPVELARLYGQVDREVAISIAALLALGSRGCLSLRATVSLASEKGRVRAMDLRFLTEVRQRAYVDPVNLRKEV
jgi:hypothetical protein